jgi:hypothetical protein
LFKILYFIPLITTNQKSTIFYLTKVYYYMLKVSLWAIFQWVLVGRITPIIQQSFILPSIVIMHHYLCLCKLSLVGVTVDTHFSTHIYNNTRWFNRTKILDTKLQEDDNNKKRIGPAYEYFSYILTIVPFVLVYIFFKISKMNLDFILEIQFIVS